MYTLELVFMGLVFFLEPDPRTGDLWILFPNPDQVHVRQEGNVITEPLARHQVLLTYPDSIAGCRPPLVLSNRANERTIELRGSWVTPGVTLNNGPLTCINPADPTTCSQPPTYREVRTNTRWIPALSTLMEALRNQPNLGHSELDPIVRDVNRLDPRLSGRLKVPAGTVRTLMLWGEDANLTGLSPRLPQSYKFDHADVSQAVSKAVVIEIEVQSGDVVFHSDGTDLETIPGGEDLRLFIYNFPEATPPRISDDCSPDVSTGNPSRYPNHFLAYYELTKRPEEVARNSPIPERSGGYYDDASCSPAFERP